MLRAWSNELLAVIAAIVMFGMQPVRVQAETAEKPTYDRPNIGEAEAFFKRILETRKQTLGENHRETLISMSDLAMVYKIENRFDDAEALLKHVLETQKRVLGEEHPDTLTSTHNLGMLYQAWGQNKKAEPLLKIALIESYRVLGKEHRDTLQRFNDAVTFFYYLKGEAVASTLSEHYYKKTTASNAETLRLQNAILGCWDYSEPYAKYYTGELFCFNDKGIENGLSSQDGWIHETREQYFLANNLLFLDGYFWGRIQKVGDNQLTLEKDDKIYIYKFLCKTEKQDIQCERLKY